MARVEAAFFGDVKRRTETTSSQASGEGARFQIYTVMATRQECRFGGDTNTCRSTHAAAVATAETSQQQEERIISTKQEKLRWRIIQ